MCRLYTVIKKDRDPSASYQYCHTPEQSHELWLLSVFPPLRGNILHYSRKQTNKFKIGYVYQVYLLRCLVNFSNTE